MRKTLQEQCLFELLKLDEATRTQRIINGKPAYEDDPIILVGATESYEPRCRKCHEVLKRD